MKTKGKLICLGVGGTVILTGGIVGGYYIGNAVTDSQIQKAKDEGVKEGYEQGLQEALENKILLEKTIAEYKSTCNTQKIELDGAKDQVKILQDNSKALNEQITAVTTSRDTWQQKANDFEIENNSLKAEKATLQTTIASDKAEIERLKATGEDHTAEIARLENKIAQDETLLASYEATIQSNLASMVEVNGKIVELSNQIVTLTAQVNNNSSIVSSLNATIAKLEKSVAYYEQFVAQLENGDQVVATFKMAGSIWGLQIVKKGTSATPATPISTEHVIFNYWMLNDEEVDPSTIILSTNTMFVANVTYRYDVIYMVDGQQHGDPQLIVSGNKPEIPTKAPTKEGYVFEGYTLDGVNLVDPTTIVITQNTTFIAKFSKLYTAKFMDEETEITTQTIKSGEFADDVTRPSTEKKTFNGWKLNGVIVNVPTTPISGDVVFVADYTYKYDVTYIVDGQQHGDPQLIVSGNKPEIPTETPTKEGYIFEGYTLDGVNLVDPTTIAITKDTVFTAKFSKLFSAKFVDGVEEIIAQTIKDGECADDVTRPSTEKKIFNGWKLNGVLVDVPATPITENVIFIADYTYKYDVKFMADGKQHGETQLVVEGENATVPTEPIKEGYNFTGWTIDGTNVVDVANYAVTADVTFIAKFVEDKSWNVLSTPNQNINALTGGTVQGYDYWKESTTYISNSNITANSKIRVTFSYSFTDNENCIGESDNFAVVSGSYVMTEFSSDGDSLKITVTPEAGKVKIIVECQAASLEYCVIKKVEIWS